jgi:hypothetical protein
MQTIYYGVSAVYPAITLPLPVPSKRELEDMKMNIQARQVPNNIFSNSDIF